MSSPKSATRVSTRRRKVSPTPSQSSSSANEATPKKNIHLLTANEKEAPVHVAQDSLFSTSSGWTNYKGFFNLAVLLLVVSNGRVALENIIKYGILISPLSWVTFASPTPQNYPSLAIVALSNITILTVFYMEKMLARGWLNNRNAVVFYVSLLIAHIVIPAVYTLEIQQNPLYSSWALSIIVMETLKLISYTHVNYWHRVARQSGRMMTDEDKDVHYPDNLTLKDLYYFMLAPTLCYELKFPRTPGRRKTFLFKRTVEVTMFNAA
jgi:diacylglycerol O-acyltransferase-1